MKTLTMNLTNNDSQHKEGAGTKKIESQTAKVPSDYFLFAAAGIMAFSLSQKVMNKSHRSLFFGQWVAPLLLFGLYNKIVKTLGHDSASTARQQPATPAL
jgi:hypothetical protein